MRPTQHHRPFCTHVACFWNSILDLLNSRISCDSLFCRSSLSRRYAISDFLRDVLDLQVVRLGAFTGCKCNEIPCRSASEFGKRDPEPPAMCQPPPDSLLSQLSSLCPWSDVSSPHCRGTASRATCALSAEESSTMSALFLEKSFDEVTGHARVQGPDHDGPPYTQCQYRNTCK